ncbi:MAG: 2-C-methyl-D-erythritol 4-phosphate cytidylyltransferase [Eubacteriales bacterium]|nr:2-C-methyl-D-erythritol 4-phosphate cytidylyltransferase [Eubacteriales bacterium]
MHNHSVCAVIVAAGGSSRMGFDKIRLELCGKPVLRWCLEAFEACAAVDGYVVVANDAALPAQIGAWGMQKCLSVVKGGQTRTASVYEGLQALPADCAIVAVHDGARCFVTADIIERTVRSAQHRGSGVAAIACVDTIKRVDGDGSVVETPDRAALRRIQTPQAFGATILRDAYAAAHRQKLTATDDAALLEMAGLGVFVVDGSPDNIKLTSPEDIPIGREILRRRTGGTAMTRIGIGYDVHRLTPGRKLILGGVEVPHTLGLLGHSDADVLTHAVMDALLGAAALGDIGALFPDTDERYAGADSLELLKEVTAHLAQNGYGIHNVDATVAAQRPKLMPYIPAMRKKLAACMGIDVAQVSVKATTTENLGFEGEELGMSARAVALLSR